MLKMRLQRVGRKHETAFRLVLTDSKNSTKSGRFKEILGSYDPRKMTEAVKADRVKYWLDRGVQATGSVHNFLINQKIITGTKINVLPKKTPPVKEAPAAEVAPAPQAEPAETPAETAPEPTPEPISEAAPEETPAPAEEPPVLE